jgi:ATP-dependent RNA circularization protein (DNA/RNA ligase family)
MESFMDKLRVTSKVKTAESTAGGTSVTMTKRVKSRNDHDE